jgi:hypothetical protein
MTTRKWYIKHVREGYCSLRVSTDAGGGDGVEFVRFEVEPCGRGETLCPRVAAPGGGVLCRGRGEDAAAENAVWCETGEGSGSDGLGIEDGILWFDSGSDDDAEMALSGGVKLGETLSEAFHLLTNEIAG